MCPGVEEEAGGVRLTFPDAAEDQVMIARVVSKVTFSLRLVGLERPILMVS
jgi:hypothetical protein